MIIVVRGCELIILGSTSRIVNTRRREDACGRLTLFTADLQAEHGAELLWFFLRSTGHATLSDILNTRGGTKATLFAEQG